MMCRYRSFFLSECQQQDNRAQDVRRRGDREGGGAVEAEAGDDDREEVGHGRGDVVARETRAHHPDLDVLDAQHQSLPRGHLVRVVLGPSVDLEAVQQLLLLERREPSDVLGRVGDDPHEDCREPNRHGSFNDEQPSPAADAMCSLELEDGQGEETAEGVLPLAIMAVGKCATLTPI